MTLAWAIALGVGVLCVGFFAAGVLVGLAAAARDHRHRADVVSMDHWRAARARLARARTAVSCSFEPGPPERRPPWSGR